MKKYVDVIVEMYDDCDLERKFNDFDTPSDCNEIEWKWNFINFYLYLTLLIII